MQLLGHLCVSQANLTVKNSIKFTHTFLYGICTYGPMLVLSSFLDGNGSCKGKECDKYPGMWLGLQPKWNTCHFFLITCHSTLYLMADPDSDKKPLPSTDTPSSDCELQLQAVLSAYATGAGSMHQVAKSNDMAYSTLCYLQPTNMPQVADVRVLLEFPLLVPFVVLLPHSISALAY